MTNWITKTKTWQEFDKVNDGAGASIVRWAFIITTAVLWGFGVFVGLCSGSDKEEGCVYSRIIQVINPGYVLGCELVRPRWHLGEK